MFIAGEKIVLAMAGIRVLSSLIEFSAAMLMLKYGRVETAFKINAALALVGPAVLFTVTSLGLLGLAGKVSLGGMGTVFLGVCLIFIGVSKL